MTDFQRDIEYLIDNGMLAAKRGQIRFVFRYSNRFKVVLEELDLSTRAHNCLKRAKINYINEIGDKWDTLNRIKNSGVTTVKEIRNKYLWFYYDRLDEDERKQFWRDTIEATYIM